MELITKPSINTEEFMNTNYTKPNKYIFKEQSPRADINNERTVALSPFGDIQELDKQVKLMMEESQNLISSGKQRAKTCKVCGKEGHGIAIRDHIESNHLEGISIPCNICERTFRSRYSLRKHKCTNEHLI